jgi:DNA adenine methylase
MNKLNPFLDWVGGKRKLLRYLDNYIPDNFHTYHEPFLGAGALFFHLKPKIAEISDINKELINCYKVIKNNIDELIQDLKTHVNEENYYYQIRSLKNLDEIKRASRMIFLMKTCFNGLYRENKKEEFNVPYGFNNKKIFDEENLRNIHEYLNNNQIKISCEDYTSILDKAKTSDFVFLDPPYHKTYSSYNKSGFNEQDHIKLSEIFKKLTEKNIKTILTNSNTEFIKNLYKDFNIKEIKITKSINPKSVDKTVNEIIVLNFNG